MQNRFDIAALFYYNFVSLQMIIAILTGRCLLIVLGDAYCKYVSNVASIDLSVCYR